MRIGLSAAAATLTAADLAVPGDVVPVPGTAGCSSGGPAATRVMTAQLFHSPATGGDYCLPIGYTNSGSTSASTETSSGLTGTIGGIKTTYVLIGGAVLLVLVLGMGGRR